MSLPVRTFLQSNYIIGFVLLCVALLVTVSIVVRGRETEVIKETEQVHRETLRDNLLAPNSDDYIYGDIEAAVTLVEYADTECQFCKRLFPKLEEIEREYAEKGIPIRIIYRHSPLGVWNKSLKEMHAAECVGAETGSKGFYTFLRNLYATTPSENNLDPDVLPQLATTAGATPKVFASCMEHGTYMEKIQQQKIVAVTLGVSTIPHLFIVGPGGVQEVVGNKPKETITFLIDQLLSTR